MHILCSGLDSLTSFGYYCLLLGKHIYATGSRFGALPSAELCGINQSHLAAFRSDFDSQRARLETRLVTLVVLGVPVESV